LLGVTLAKLVSAKQNPEAQMNPIFIALQNMTGGLLNDATALVIGMVTLGFIAMGFQMLIENLGLSFLNRRADRFVDNADKYLDLRNKAAKGTRQYDEADMSYKLSLRESVSSRFKAGKL
jgi:hypothetical protein